MKRESTLSTTGFSRRLSFALLTVCMLVVPMLGYSQPAPPPGSGGSGTSPDTPLGVPFSGEMNIAFAIVGVIFAVMVMRKLQKKPTLN